MSLLTLWVHMVRPNTKWANDTSPALLLHKLPAHYSNAAHLAREEGVGVVWVGEVKRNCQKKKAFGAAVGCSKNSCKGKGKKGDMGWGGGAHAKIYT